MAEFGGDLQRFTATAVATILIHQAVRFAAAGEVNVSSDAGAAFAVGAIGIAQAQANSGDHVPVGWIGESKVIAGASVTAGRLLATNSIGHLVHAGSGDIAFARAQEAAADNETFRALLFPAFRLSGTN